MRSNHNYHILDIDLLYLVLYKSLIAPSLCYGAA